MPETTDTIFAPEAEQGVLAAVMLEPQRFVEVAYLRPEHFYRATHQHVWASLTRLAPHGIQDFVTVTDDIVAHGGLTAAWASRDELTQYLQEFAYAMPGAEGAETYARIVHDYWQRREVSRICGEALRDTREGQRGSDLVSRLLVRVGECAHGAGVSGSRAIGDYVAEAENLRASGGIVGIPSGIPELDDMTQGWVPGRLVVVGARPGQGKSSLLSLFVAHAMREAADSNILFFSLEMSGRELATKLICMRAGVDSNLYMRGMLSADDSEKARGAAASLKGNLWIDETPNLTIQELTLRAKAHAAKHGGIALLGVDYLGLAKSEGANRKGGQQRYEEVGDVSRGLKILSQELRCPVIAAHQLRRESEDTDAPPKLRDLRESGSCEQDADQVILLHPFKTDPENKIAVDWRLPVRPVDIWVAKNRHGAQGKVRVNFRKACTRFEPLAGPLAGDSGITMSEAKRLFCSPTKPLPGDD